MVGASASAPTPVGIAPGVIFNNRLTNSQEHLLELGVLLKLCAHMIDGAMSQTESLDLVRNGDVGGGIYVNPQTVKDSVG